ncbi:uncharacterized protein LOC135389779 [Ornithodoros turicata]|uniref:uncharacterized protein LOC135389779 n=1 Tax=Ornithodoros turicata TaxID=34597 RepID=UPI003138AA13
MVQEKQPRQFGLRKHQEVERDGERPAKLSIRKHPELSLTFISMWNGTGKTTAAIWPQKTPRGGARRRTTGEIEHQKTQRVKLEWYRKNNRGNLASENAKRWSETENDWRN